MATLDYDELTPAQWTSYEAGLRSSHPIRLDVKLRNRDEQPVGSLTAPINRVLAGSVQVDASQDVSRSLDLTLLDPQGDLKFEAASPAQGALFTDRFVSVRYEVWVAALASWVSVPVFWGPLSGYSRAGSEVTIEAQGKERLMLSPHLATSGYMLEKGIRLDDAIRKVAGKVGETRYDLPNIGATLPKARAVSATSEPWRTLTGGMTDANGQNVPGIIDKGPGDRNAFYDGRGRLTVRNRARNVSWQFEEGVDLLTYPTISYDVEEFRNYVIVRGAKAKGKKPASGRATLPAVHPLSPDALGRNGKPRYMTEFLETDLKTDAECEARAEEILSNRFFAGLAAEFDCLPAPHLEEHDLCRIVTENHAYNFVLKQFTIPLTSTDAMSIGVNRRVKRWRRRRHYRRGRR